MNIHLVTALQNEITWLRSQLPRDTLIQAHADARALALAHFSGHSTSRRTALNAGMSERRWMRARALLMAARVYSNRGWTFDDINLVHAALERTVNSTARSGSLDSLRMRMARDGR